LYRYHHQQSRRHHPSYRTPQSTTDQHLSSIKVGSKAYLVPVSGGDHLVRVITKAKESKREGKKERETTPENLSSSPPVVQAGVRSLQISRWDLFDQNVGEIRIPIIQVRLALRIRATIWSDSSMSSSSVATHSIPDRCST
jgi:hypothetical protein